MLELGLQDLLHRLVQQGSLLGLLLLRTQGKLGAGSSHLQEVVEPPESDSAATVPVVHFRLEPVVEFVQEIAEHSEPVAELGVGVDQEQLERLADCCFQFRWLGRWEWQELELVLQDLLRR